MIDPFPAVMSSTGHLIALWIVGPPPSVTIALDPGHLMIYVAPTICDDRCLTLDPSPAPIEP